MQHVAQANSRKADSPAILRAQAVKKAYQMGEAPLVILKHIDLTLREGEFVAIEGRSGSGKSTLLHILCGLDSADSGGLEYRGKKIRRQPAGTIVSNAV